VQYIPPRPRCKAGDGQRDVTGNQGYAVCARERDAAAGRRTGTGDGRGPTTAATLDGAELEEAEQRPSDPVGGPWAVGGHW